MVPPREKSIKKPAPRQDLQQERPARISWSRMKDAEVVEFAIQRISEKGIHGRNEFQKACHQHYEVLRTRGLLEEIGLDESRKGTWRLMSDKEVLALARKQVGEGGITRKIDFKKHHPKTYKAVCQRRLMEHLSFQPQSMDWSAFSNSELVEHANRFLREKGITGKKEMQDCGGWKIYTALYKRGLLGEVSFEKKTIFWASMGNTELVAFALEQKELHGITGRSEFKRKLGKAYDALHKRGLLELIPLEQKQVKWSSIPNREVLRIAAEAVLQHSITNRGQFQGVHPHLYKVLYKRNLLEKAGFPPKRRNRWEKMGNPALVAFAKTYCSANNLFTKAELRGSYPSLYRTLFARSEKKNLFADVGILSSAEYRQLTSKQLLDFVRKYLERDGLETFAELKESNLLLYLEIKSRNLALHTGLIVKKAKPVENPEDIERRKEILGRVQKKVLSAIDSGDIWELKRFMKLDLPMEDKLQMLESMDARGHTPLMRAAIRGDIIMLSNLVAHGVEVDARGGSGETAFMLAAENERLGAADALLAAGAGIDSTDNLGWTSLMVCAIKGLEAPVLFLRGRGADASIRDEDGFSAKELALERGHFLLAEKISSYGKGEKSSLPGSVQRLSARESPQGISFRIKEIWGKLAALRRTMQDGLPRTP